MVRCVNFRKNVVLKGRVIKIERNYIKEFWGYFESVDKMFWVASCDVACMVYV